MSQHTAPANWKVALAQFISFLVQMELLPENIRSDEFGWGPYIPAKSLRPNQPLLLINQFNALHMVMSYIDYEKFENGITGTSIYVDSSKWNYGYYNGLGDPIRGIYWSQLSKRSGIEDINLVQRYIRLTRCRVLYTATGKKVTQTQCELCPLDSCSFSKYKHDTPLSKAETPSYDSRSILFDRLYKYLTETFGFRVPRPHVHKKDSILISPAFKRSTAIISLPAKMLVDMLYEPNSFRYTDDIFDLPLMVEDSLYGDHIPFTREDQSINFFYELWDEIHWCKRDLFF